MKLVVTGTRGIPYIMGGVEKHCEELFPRLAAMGVDVTVVRRTAYARDSLTEWRGVKIKDIPAPKRKAFEAVVHTWRAVRYAAREKADVLYLNAVGPALLTPVAKLLGLKVIFVHHGPDYDRDKWGRIAKAMLKLGERMGCRYADKVIVISELIRNHIKERYGRTENVHLIHNGVSKPDFCEEPEWLAQLGVEPGKYVMGMSRLVPEKRLHELIAAFQAAKLPEGTKLVIAGAADFEDAYSRKLRAQAAAAGVVMPGALRGKKLHSLLTAASCFVLPSSHEGLPIALLEAMSYRLPVIVSDIPANLEVGLPKDCYFPLGNLPALASALEKLYAERPQKLDYDMSAYDWDTIAGQVFVLL
ncbi:MAG: glycosyltransferase family 4 protein [Bacteroidales bacterium]|nr:glycosyltransferase family 4 protein [Bacteroidales bacterium]